MESTESSNSIPSLSRLYSLLGRPVKSISQRPLRVTQEKLDRREHVASRVVTDEQAVRVLMARKANVVLRGRMGVQ